jgi:DNA-binding transcriptional LysR family regulator
MQPEIAQIQAFVAVATLLHFGRAAEQLHITQPAVSHRVQALEEILGIELLERTTRHVSLTPAGAAYLKRVTFILGDLSRATEEALGVAAGQQGRLVVAYSGALSTSPLIHAVEKLAKRRPAVSIEVRRLGFVEQLQALRAGEVDVGSTFLESPLELPGLSERSLPMTRLFLHVSGRHRLARHRSVGFADLSGERWIALSERAEPGFSRQNVPGGTAVAVEVDALDAALHLVARGVGVAVLPQSTVLPPSVRQIPLRGPRGLVRVFTRKAGEQPLVAELLSSLKTS